LKPGSTSRRRITLLIRSPAQISKTSASATSATTSALRSGLRVEAAPEWRPPSESVSFRSGREARQAGMIPKRIPVSTDIRAVKARTVVSSSI
jgi:hypothetical protein